MLPIFTSRKVKGLKKGVLYVTVGALSLYGIAAFVKRGFPGYMFGKTVFAFFLDSRRSKESEKRGFL